MHILFKYKFSILIVSFLVVHSMNCMNQRLDSNTSVMDPCADKLVSHLNEILKKEKSPSNYTGHYDYTLDQLADQHNSPVKCLIITKNDQIDILNSIIKAQGYNDNEFIKHRDELFTKSDNAHKLVSLLNDILKKETNLREPNEHTKHTLDEFASEENNPLQNMMNKKNEYLKKTVQEKDTAVAINVEHTKTINSLRSEVASLNEQLETTQTKYESDKQKLESTLEDQKKNMAQLCAQISLLFSLCHSEASDEEKLCANDKLNIIEKCIKQQVETIKKLRKDLKWSNQAEIITQVNESSTNKNNQRLENQITSLRNELTLLNTQIGLLLDLCTSKNPILLGNSNHEAFSNDNSSPSNRLKDNVKQVIQDKNNLETQIKQLQEEIAELKKSLEPKHTASNRLIDSVPADQIEVVNSQSQIMDLSADITNLRSQLNQKNQDYEIATNKHPILITFLNTEIQDKQNSSDTLVKKYKNLEDQLKKPMPKPESLSWTRGDKFVYSLCTLLVLYELFRNHQAILTYLPIH